MKKFAGFLLIVLFLSTWTAARAETSVKLLDFTGRAVALSAVQRDATLIAFWIAACVPCIEEMPLLEALHKKLGGDSHVAVIGVNLDEDEDLAAAQKIIAARKLSYPMLRDPGRELVRKWFPEHPQQLPLPTVLVTDRQLHALYSQGFKTGTSAATFIATCSPRLTAARSGKLLEPLQRADTAAATDLTQLTAMVEKLIRSRHPELSDADIKLRVAGAIKEFQSKGTLSIE